MSSHFTPRGNGNDANSGRGSFDFTFRSSRGETRKPFYDRGPSSSQRRGGELRGRALGGDSFSPSRAAYIPSRGRGGRITLEQHLRSQGTGANQADLAPSVEPEPPTFTWEPPVIPPPAYSPIPDHLRQTVYLPAPGSHISAREKFERLSREKREEEARERHQQDARQRRNARLISTSAPESTSTYTELAGRDVTHRWMKSNVGSVIQTGKPTVPSQSGTDIISQAIERSGVGGGLPRALEPSRKRQRDSDVYGEEDFDDLNFIEDYPNVEMAGRGEANTSYRATSERRLQRSEEVAGRKEATNWDEFQPTLHSLAWQHEETHRDKIRIPGHRRDSEPLHHDRPHQRGGAPSVERIFEKYKPAQEHRLSMSVGLPLLVDGGRRRIQTRETADAGAAAGEQLEEEEEEDEVEIVT
ncbi:MAG: hypothetical protein Q9181_002503 [Wetmoreana brouardii]